MVLSMGCKEPSAASPLAETTAAQTTQQKPVESVVAAPVQPTPPDQTQWTEALFAREPELIQQVLTRYDLAPGSVEVKMSDTLFLTASHEGRTCERQVAKGWVEAELITNFDHTLDYCVREIMKPQP